MFELSYIDHWRRCERCGAPFGAVQCSECNPVVMADLGMKKPPYTACVSVANFDAASARLITTYKDKNEQRLASALGSMMCEVIPPKWLEVNPDMQISFVPASAKALRRRGFDHAELLAREVGWGLSLPVTSLFERPASKDQRSLTRHERIFNMEQRFRVLEKELPRSILLVDDVYTTGSTLSFASKKLLERGAKSVYCLTFARVW
ncbi:MAG: ComF family protein [Raoultibacter sp.]